MMAARGKSFDLRSLGITRIAVATITWLAAGFVIVSQGAANAIGPGAPPLLLAATPWESDVPSRTATLFLLQPQLPDAARLAGESAIAAWRRDPTNQAAVRTLWELKRQNGDSSAAVRLGKTANAFGWRDYLTQIYSARDLAQAGDNAGAARRISAALTTSVAVREQVMPTFVKLTSDPKLVNDLAEIIAAKPDWIDQFNAEWVPNAPSSVLMAALSRRLDELGSPVSATTRSGIIGRLITDEQFGLALREYQTGRPQLRAAGRTLADGFRHVFDYRPFDWLLSEGEDVSGYIERSKAGSPELAGDVAANSAGEVARRILVLPAGSYDISGRAEFDGGEGKARASASVICAKGGAVLAQGDSRQGTFRTRFQVPSSCPAVYTVLSADNQSPEAVTIRFQPLSLQALSGNSSPQNS